MRRFILGCVVVLAWPAPLAASDHAGQVSFGGVAVPGATVIASGDGRRLVTSTDARGVYRLTGLTDGAWTIQVEMLGFSTLVREISVPADAAPLSWELALLPFEEIAKGKAMVQQKPDPANPDTIGPARPEPGATAAPTDPFRRAVMNVAPAGASVDGAFGEPTNDGGMGAADGFLINGSVNNGAASPFAQLRAFGNNRPGQRSLYNGGVGVLGGHSGWDARPYSFSGRQSSKPSYSDVHLLGSFGGPLRMPGLRNRANLFVGYQRTADHRASTESARMPTLLERNGDFSRTVDALGRPVRIVDPATGEAFPGNLVPPGRISPQAASLLRYYPLPQTDAAGHNYQATVLSAARQDSLQSRATQPIDARNQIAGSVAFQRTATDRTSLFGFEDAQEVAGFDTAASWSHRLSQFFSIRLRYQLIRLTDETTPYFAGRTNVSGEAGIAGNNQEPINWGPPSLTFSSGTAGLADALPAFTRTGTHGWSAEGFLGRGRHNITVGGSVRRHQIDIRSQQDPRGAFAFTGAATGADLADFLLGIPHTISIAYGNADKFFRSRSYDAFAADDWRVSPSLTINAGLRWEYEAPITERFGRLVNLDVAPGFAAVGPVVAADPTGPITGARYPGSLMRPDRRGLQPRIGAAWRPVAGSSLVVRAGYGIYRNTSVYPSIATLLAQQPPLSTAFSVENGASRALTMADGFAASGGAAANTFAVDPGFRVGFAHNWQVSMQRDLPASLHVMGTYLGTAGRRLMQQVLPNTYPAGTTGACDAGSVARGPSESGAGRTGGCPSGFVHLTSNGSSSRHALQLQLRRRLRNGLSATTTYTLAEAIDNAAAFGGASLAGASIAQNWLDLEAERGPSNFDQRHLLTAQIEYTSGMGVGGGALLSGLKGALLKGWTFSGQLTVGSGLPLTPVYLTPVRGTGVSGTIRAGLTGAAIDAPPGFYLNPAAYAPPAPGVWGDAGRNSARGPSQHLLNAGISRTFAWGDRMNLDWRIEGINVLNHVTYSSVDTLVGSPQFGLPNRANPMRKLHTSLRLRF